MSNAGVRFWFGRALADVIVFAVALVLVGAALLVRRAVRG